MSEPHADKRARAALALLLSAATAWSWTTTKWARHTFRRQRRWWGCGA